MAFIISQTDFRFSAQSFPLSNAVTPALSPVIPAKAGIRRLPMFSICPRARYARARRLVRIRIYGIIRFSGFYRRVFYWQTNHPVFVLAGFSVMAKSGGRANRNPVNPANPENPDSDKTRNRSPRPQLSWERGRLARRAASAARGSPVLAFPNERVYRGIGLRLNSGPPKPRLRAAHPHPSLPP